MPKRHDDNFSSLLLDMQRHNWKSDASLYSYKKSNFSCKHKERTIAIFPLALVASQMEPHQFAFLLAV